MNSKSNCKQVLFFFTMVLILILMMPVTAFAVTDTSEHWAKEQINQWSAKAVIKGYPDHTFKPDNNITRAEFFTIINQVFGFKERAVLDFSDVSPKAWYYDEIAKAVAAGYATGYPDGSIKPQAHITRQEAAKVVVKAFGLENGTSLSLTKFKDAAEIENWAESSVTIMKDKGFIHGYPDGTFRPENKIKRAETVTILDNAGGNIFNQAGTYSEETKGNLVVNTGKVTLKDMKIPGDLYLAEGIGDGEVTLDGVTVKGKTVVRGGGENSIILRNTALGDIEVNKPKGTGQPVRLLAEGSTSVSGTVTVNSGLVLEEKNIAQGATGFNNVIVSDKLSETAKVLFSGEFNAVTLTAQKGIIEISKDATVAAITVQAAAKLVITEGAKVTTVTVTETAKGAKIETMAGVVVQINAENVTVNNTAVAKGSTAQVSSGGTTTITTPTTGGSGNGGSTAGTRVTLSIPDDGVIPYHFDAIVKNTQNNTPLTGLVAGDFSLKKGQINIPLNSEAFHEWLSENQENNVPGRYTIYPTNEYRPMDGDYTLTFSKTGYVTTTAAFKVGELIVTPAVELTNLELSGMPANYAFASGTYTYEGITVPNSQETIAVTPTLAGATLTVDGTAVNSGEAVAIPLAAGIEKTITVNVSKAGYVAKDYLIKVTRTIPVWTAGGATDGPITLNPAGADNITYGPESGSHTINGNLIIEGSSTGEISLQNLAISGDLTINTPNATVNVTAGVTVTGATYIQAVSPNTFNSAGSHNGAIQVKGTAALNLSGNASQAPVEVSTTSPVKLKGSINLVRVLLADAVINIDSGTVNYLQIEVNNVDVNNQGGTLTHLLVKETVEVPPVTSGTVPPAIELIPGLTDISITVGDQTNNSNSLVLGEGETLAASSSAINVAAAAIGGAGNNEVRVIPVAAGRSTINVQVKNSSDELVKAGTFMVTVAQAAPDSEAVAVSQPAPDEAVGQTKVNIGSSLEFRITNAAGSIVKQNWTPGTGAARKTQAITPLTAGDRLEIRVKAVGLIPASAKFTYTVQQGDIGTAEETVTEEESALIQGAKVTITTGSAVFNYEFYGADQSPIPYEEALTDPYNLDLTASSVRLERRNGEAVTYATDNISIDTLNITPAGSVSYADLAAVEAAFGNPDFMKVWQGPPTHIVLVLKGGLGEDAWELNPITIQLEQSDREAFASIMSSPGEGGTPAAFTPGEGGSLPSFTTFSEESGKIGGLYVDKSQRENNYFSSGNRPVVELAFAPPSEYAAAGYTLQYSEDNGSSWQNYQYYGENLSTVSDSQDNFSFNPEGSYKYRLLVNGGEYDGWVSNDVEAPLSAVATAFSGWHLDESMFITGVMTPYAGSGKEAAFTVTSLADGSAIQGYLSYQWYRVNPVSFAMTPIPGATDLTYTTTPEDAGYYLLCRADGDGENVGGFAQIISYWAPEIPNQAYVSNVTPTGFRLNLHKSLSGLTPEDLKLYYLDEEYKPVNVPITSVTHVENNAVYQVAAAIPLNAASLRLDNTSRFWRLVSGMGEHHLMPYVEISLP